MLCKDCKNPADYICSSGRCVPCERKFLGKDGIEMLRVIMDLTKEGKYSIPKEIATNEFNSRTENE